MLRVMKRICLQAFIGMITAWTAVSCSSEPAACGCGDDGSTIPVSFTMNTPAGEAVPYGTTRATHDEEMCIRDSLEAFMCYLRHGRENKKMQIQGAVHSP